MAKIYGKLFLLRNWKKYIIVVLLILVQCKLFQNDVVTFGKIAQKTYDISVGDYIANFFKGNLPYTMLKGDVPFNIPAIWSLYLIYYFAVIARSVSQVSQRHEQQLMLRCVTRKKWWGYQNLMMWMETAGYLAVTYLTFLIYGILSGAKVFGMNRELQSQLNGVDISKINGVEIVLKLMLLSFLFYSVGNHLYTVHYLTSDKRSHWCRCTGGITCQFGILYEPGADI